MRHIKKWHIVRFRYNDKSIFELALADTMMRSITEEELYGFISFLAEFGGALGLFVGWSLLSVFNLMEVIRKVWPDLKK